MSNLTYLIDNGWVKTVDIEKTVAVKGGTIPQVTTFHEITAKGIDKIEGGSQFEPKERYADINLTATGKNSFPWETATSSMHNIRNCAPPSTSLSKP